MKPFVSVALIAVVRVVLCAPLYAQPPTFSDTSAPTVYLTFDDGPHQNGTQIVANLALQEHIPVSFFMIGLHLKEASPKLKSNYEHVKTNPYVEILNHSYSHAYRNHFSRFYADLTGAVEDVEKNQIYMDLKRKIVRLPGSNVWRTPNKNRNDAPLKRRNEISDSLVAHHYAIIGWDLEWHFDYKTLVLKQSPQEIMHEIEKLLAEKKTMCHNHLVLLTHERSFSPKAGEQKLLELIHLIKQKKYHLNWCSNYPLLFSFVQSTPSPNPPKCLPTPHFDKKEGKENDSLGSIFPSRFQLPHPSNEESVRFDSFP